MHEHMKKICIAGMFAALTCVATMVFHIPTNFGYANLGDCFVLLGACFLGPGYGFAAGGIGSALADLLTGYAYYVPGTLIIKGGIAWIFAMLLRGGRGQGHPVYRTVCAVGAEVWMVLGYWFYKALILGKGAAALTSIPSNLAQGTVGVVLFTVAYVVITRIPALKKGVVL